MRTKTLEQWKNIYGIMKEIKLLKTRDYLYNDIPVTIKNVFSEDIYVTVLGNDEDVFKLIIYPNEYEFYKAYC